MVRGGKHLAQNTHELPLGACKLPEYHRKVTHIIQVVLHAELMQICPRLACKIACFCWQKYMQLTGKNTRSAGKNTHNLRKKNMQFHAELLAIAGNLQSQRG